MTALATVVILAAGKGTRMRSRTPKVLHDLCGIPMILWPVRAALGAGADQLVVVDTPERALAPVLPDGVALALQPRADGTGGALLAAMDQLDADGRGGDGPVVVLSGDVPLVSSHTITELLQAHSDSGAQATMASALLDDPSGYGRVVRDSSGAVQRVVETKADGDATAQELEIGEVNTGVYVFSAPALRAALGRLSADNAQGELYLPQALEEIRADGGTVTAHVVADQHLVLGVNDRAALARVRTLAQRAIHERHMLAGVTIVDPSTTVIDVEVRIGQDTTIEPFTTIRGATSIGEGCTVRHSYLVDCLLEDGVSVGPFAYLRPGTVLRAHAKAGTFVEIKNSDVGVGAKIPHLSYIGDADVGEDTNLGASTVTANYDGQAKHRTHIGPGVRTGVDTTFVAPVTVGEGAYTAAGSVVTKDVPPGALAVARARQENLEDYVRRRANPSREGDGPPA
ncbi:MAG TPA: bifunctional UDP-N-acetylglucosamine diphosphorylase/glucosamine-1-phosphate N-acetyltransferase GlmU [Solirubrobacteraceae bacterium]|nr:bifunctional UDP-N-acetylglucosamine diphosphorylase/glucosamine-1-phosphate N-acetyltransferase GlmU [Solirubrobacteraceae bacterium]